MFSNTAMICKIDLKLIGSMYRFFSYLYEFSDNRYSLEIFENVSLTYNSYVKAIYMLIKTDQNTCLAILMRVLRTKKINKQNDSTINRV